MQKSAKILNKIILLSIWIYSFSWAQIDTLPLSQKVLYGKFDNGFTYYIYPNSYPKNKVSLYLVVNVGSIVEKENEKGFAHFVEHMAFNGTKHFPKNTMIDFLRSLGAKFGPDANAITNFDESLYLLHIPIEKVSDLDKAFLILEDWARWVQFHADEVEKEKGVIIEEWRMRMGPFERFQRQYIPELFNHSLYAERLPIGDLDLIQKAKPSDFKHFYQQWYHPFLMAVIVVGDIEPSKIEKHLKNHFEKIKPKTTAPKRIQVTIPDNDEPNIVIGADKEFPFTWFYLSIRRPFQPVRTKEDLKRHLLDQIVLYLLNERYEELLLEEDVPLSQVELTLEHIIRPYEFLSWYGYGNAQELEKGFIALWKEAARVYQHGFLPSELEQAKLSLIEKYRSIVEKPIESKRIADTLVKHFLTHQQFSDPIFTYDLVKELLKEIDVNTLNTYYRTQIFTKKNRTIVIGISGDSSEVTLPSKDRIRYLMDSIEKANLPPYEERFTVADLLQEKLLPHLSIKKKEKLEYGVKKVVFDNNLTVYLYPTKKIPDEIILWGRSPGGRSLYPPDQDKNLYFADEVAFESGIGQYPGAEIKKLLQQKGIQISFKIEDYWEEFKIIASKRNFSEALQVFYSYLTNVRQDSSFVFQYLKKRKAIYQNYAEHPLAYFFIQFIEDLYQHNPRFLLPPDIPKPSYFEGISFPDIYKRFQERYQYINDFDIVVVGDFSEDTLLTQLNTYLGNLPSHEGLREEWVDMGLYMREGAYRKVFYKGQDPLATVAFILHDKFSYNTPQERIKLKVLEEILKRRLINHLREKAGGTYTIQTQLDVQKYPYSYYAYLFYFNCHPSRVDSLIHFLHNDFEDLVLNGPMEEEVNMAKAQLLKEYEEKVQKNPFIAEKLIEAILNHELVRNVFEFPNHLNALTREDIHHAALHYLNSLNRLEYILLPEQYVQSQKP